MKYIRILIVLLTVLLSAKASFAASSSSVSLPSQQTAVTQVTVTVTHITQNNVGYNHSVYCPKRVASSLFTGYSPLIDATLIGNDKFFPNGPTYWSNGIVVYNCSETYWSNDPYYISLANNNIVSCQNAAYSGERCTTKGRDMNNMIGVLPIHFVINTPSQTIVRNQAYSTYNRVGFMAPASYPFVSGSLASYVPNGGWAQEFSLTPGSVGLNLSVNLLWQATYTQSDGGGVNGYSYGGSGNFDVLARCPDYAPFPNAGYSYIPISNDMLGKTCTLSCNEGKWNLYGPSGNPNDNAGGGSGTYFGAPLIVSCE